MGWEAWPAPSFDITLRVGSQLEHSPQMQLTPASAEGLLTQRSYASTSAPVMGGWAGLLERAMAIEMLSIGLTAIHTHSNNVASTLMLSVEARI